jgi:hypothetical protein
MSGAGETLGGARWISVEPKGTMEQLGDFLSNIGFVTPGEQSLAVAGVILLIIAVVWAMSRPMQVRVTRGAPVSGRSGAGGAVRRGAPVDLAPLPFLPGAPRAERGEALPLRPASPSARAQAWLDPVLGAKRQQGRSGPAA